MITSGHHSVANRAHDVWCRGGILDCPTGATAVEMFYGITDPSSLLSLAGYVSEGNPS